MKLIHTPSMRMPQRIIDPRVVYTCIHSVLVEAVKNNSKVVMLPAFGHLTGGVKAEYVARPMKLAYESVTERMNDISENTWDRHIVQIDEVLLGHFIYQ